MNVGYILIAIGLLMAMNNVYQVGVDIGRNSVHPITIKETLPCPPNGLPSNFDTSKLTYGAPR